jgi:predicted Zn-dependent peptidase
VTPEDIMMVAKKYFKPENRTVVLLTMEGGNQ